MSSLTVFRTFPGFPTPTAANSLPSPIEHIPCSVEITAAEKVVVALHPNKVWSSLIPLPVKPAGKMPSSIFHIYTNGEVAIPKHVRLRAAEVFDRAASNFAKLIADEDDITGLAKPNPVRYTPAQRAAIAKAVHVAVVRRPAKVTAPVPPPVRGLSQRPRWTLPIKVNNVKAPTKPKVEVKPTPTPTPTPTPKPKAKVEVRPKPKSILKPARNDNVEYVRHCSEAPPDTKGCLLPATESIANSTVSRFPTSEWDYKNLPIDTPDRFKKLVFRKQETGEALDLGALPTKVKFHEHLVSDSWTARGRAVIRNHAVVRYRLKSKA